MLDIKIKLSEGASLPTYANDGDAGMDLVSTGFTTNEELGFDEHSTGVHVEIPKGYVGLVFPRSSISKMGQLLANKVGVIDAPYRGEIKVRFKPDSFSTFKKLMNIILRSNIFGKDDFKIYEKGDKIAQLVVLKCEEVNWLITDELTTTSRGEGGFGSSDKK